ncbi:MAG: NADH-quinone oxidoreductase subunit N [Buchnera aphidicola (Melaphis rhois)]
MIITAKQLIALSPIFILVLTVVIIMLLIAYNRDHFFTFLCSITGLTFTLLSLYIIRKDIPIDITVLFHIDKYSLLYISMIVLSSIFSCIFSYSYLKRILYNCEEYYLLLLFSTIGCISLIIANHMSIMFIGMELISLPALGLIAYAYFKKNSLEAAFKYMILSGAVSVLALFGIALIYSITGSLTFSSVIYELVTSISSPDNILLCGLGLVILAFSFKLSMFPFHIWTPDVYNGTISIVLTYLSTATKIAVFSLFFKTFIFLTSFNVEFFRTSLEAILCLSIIFGNFMAFFQTSIKRFLGYSSISQFGYFSVSLLSSNDFHFSLEVVGVCLIGYLLSSIGIFGLISIVSSLNNESKSDSITFYRGLFWSNPIFSSIMTIMLLSLSGIPMTIGFIGKFYILSLIVKENFWFLGIIFLIGSIIGMYSYLRIITCLYLKPLDSNSEMIHLNSSHRNHIIFLLIISLMVLLLGVYPNIVIDIVSTSEPILFNIIS